MQRTIDPDTVAKPATEFLIDHVGIDHDSVARLLGIDLETLDSILNGAAPPEGCTRTIRILAAMQSLLLGAYTPESASAWMNVGSPHLGGRIPAAVLIGGHPDALRMVFDAVLARVSA